MTVECIHSDIRNKNMYLPFIDCFNVALPTVSRASPLLTMVG